ncbi:MAG: hypothetical protein Q8903_09890, partial [Bacteroidota bacterium]|nr:hypothetical protein [Bacteroidota bacterium]
MSETNNKYWPIVILILSLYVLVQFFYELIIPVSPEHLLIYDRIDAFICFIFLGDYFYFLSRSNNKKKFIRTHWLDLISSIPFVELF